MSIETSKLQIGSILISEYARAMIDTDVLGNDVAPVLMGLFGEVGGIMAAAKKHVREGNAFPGFRAAAEEEFGDALWYFAALCRRFNVPIENIFEEITLDAAFRKSCAASDLFAGAVACIATPKRVNIDDALFELGKAAAVLLHAESEDSQIHINLKLFAVRYLEALGSTGLSFAAVVRTNQSKAQGAFVTPDPSVLPRFDDGFETEEQIPNEFRIRIEERKTGKSYLRWNDVFIGDALTDNISDPDGYRFHDVFHLSYAAILHWSPVFRALIKQKRKSKTLYDETEDGGRAIVIEEGLTAWIFARAKSLNHFEGQGRVSLDILKTIKEFVSGYEVEACPLKLWERAILDGYSIFRKLRETRGGYVIGNRESRSIRFEELG